MSMASHDLMSAHIRIFNLGNLRRLDIWLSGIVLILAAIGVMVLYSTTRSTSSATPFYLRQMMFIPVGCILALLIMCIDYRFLVSLAPLFYVVLIGALVAVLLVGVEVKGATRWLQLGPIRIQPSEQSKLALIFMLAWYLSSIENRVRKIPYFLLTFVIAAIPALLIFRQPNLGTAATLAPVVFAMLYVAGCKRSHLVGIVLMALVAAPVGWSQLKDYQKTRVMTIFNPGADALGSGYHTTQSMITVGSGGPFGKGYMEGTQTYLSYLPEHHTDFIFSVLAEEWGFVGSVGVVGLFLLLFMRSLYIARKSPEMSGSLLAVGIVALLAFHVFVNIAITLGIAPVTGIPLPFLSYGRSFYLTTMLCIGVLLSINTRKGLFF
ncbi:MAG: rod shape-determining protein RodA [Candidatus Hydrogenedentota bacterium]|nr:MAG: rod shape-determining protein RodA [Candidatus Hydrogenedentota bacterium]